MNQNRINGERKKSRGYEVDEKEKMNKSCVLVINM